MADLSFINNKTKIAVGALSIVLSIIVYIMTPPYIEFYLIFLFWIPAILLLVPNDAIKSSKPIGVLTIILVAVVAYLAINGIMNVYDITTNLYVTGQLPTVPTANDISTCTMGYTMVLIYALFNLICAALFFIPSSSKKDKPNF